MALSIMIMAFIFFILFQIKINLTLNFRLGTFYEGDLLNIDFIFLHIFKKHIFIKKVEIYNIYLFDKYNFLKKNKIL